MRYLATTPKNPNYKGSLYGVQFQKGRAVIDDLTVPPDLGRTADDIARLLKRDFPAVVVEEVDPSGIPGVSHEPEPKPTRAPARSAGEGKKAEKVEA